MAFATTQATSFTPWNLHFLLEKYICYLRKHAQSYGFDNIANQIKVRI